MLPIKPSETSPCSAKMKVLPVDIRWSEALPIHSSDKFLRSMSRDYGWIGGIDLNGTLRCALPFVRFHKAFLRIVRFSSETLCFGERIDAQSEREFLSCVVDYFRTSNADIIIPSTFSSLFRTYPEGAVAAEYGTYVIQLQQPEDVLWARVHPKHRNKIRNAERRGVTIRTTPDLDDVFRLVRRSFERSSKGPFGTLKIRLRMNARKFREQTTQLAEHAETFVAEHDGRIQGCAVVHFSRFSAYYMHGGTTDDPVTGAMNLLHWVIIRSLRARGITEYNFVGARLNPEPASKQEGILHFKQRFGGDLRRGYMWKYYLNPWKAPLYRWISRLRSSGDVVDQIQSSSEASPQTDEACQGR